MKAKDLSGQAPGGSRRKLADVLPLATPFVVQIFPVYACNFKCGYCIFSVKKYKRHFISDETSMELGLFKKCIDGMAEFPEKIKVLRFVGIGEPLLHKNIVDMVQYASRKNIANTIEILTNAATLSPEMSEALLAAGLSRMVVSLQGTSKEKYKEICGANLDFESFLANLEYFYARKGDAQLYLKIVDCALDGPEDQEKFYNIFGNICDTIAIEHAVPIHAGVEFDKILSDNSGEVTQFGLPVSEVKVCPQPFFHMQVNPDGNVVPCYSFEYPEILGNVNTESLCKIWTNRKFQRFRCRMLEGLRQKDGVCRDCTIITYRLFPEDVLEDYTEQLKGYYETDET